LGELRKLRAVGLECPDAAQHGIVEREARWLLTELRGCVDGGEDDERENGIQSATHDATPFR